LTTSFSRSENAITIFVHVPAVAEASIATLYKYVDYPYPLSDSTGSSRNGLFLDDAHTMIAAAPNHRYTLLSQLDLDACAQFHQTWLCPRIQSFRTRFEDTCLGALFAHLAPAVEQRCLFTKRPLQESVLPLPRDEFVILPLNNYSALMTCRNSTQVPVEITLPSVQVRIPRGCHLDLTHYTIINEWSDSTTLDIVAHKWLWSPASTAFPPFMPAEITAALVKSHQRIKSLEEAAIALSVGPMAPLVHHVGSLVVWPIVAILLIAAICGVGWFLYHRPEFWVLLRAASSYAASLQAAPPAVAPPSTEAQ
jgi:hypothetical protein